MNQSNKRKKGCLPEQMLRASILNWYPFLRGERALLLGRDTEPLITLLEQHYFIVDTVAVEELQNDVINCYDCIVVVDVVERCGNVLDFLQKLRIMLADNGVVLLVYRNRFGLKYLCGGIDEVAETPFVTLQPIKIGPRLYARREMESMLIGAGFEKPRHYFLMPDADFVQAVYTDEHLPDESIRDRVFSFDLHDSPLVAWEADLYDDVVREGTLPFLTNVYLAECRKPGAKIPPKQVIYAALSTDRGPNHAFATVLYTDDTARKIPLFQEGHRALEQLYVNMETLKKQGILTVEHKLTENGIDMPLVQEEGLLHYLRRQLPSNPERFLAVFEQIYQDVLQSSAIVKQLPDDLSDDWGARAEELKPILENAWIDMIPYNAFWGEGKIRYYDQEFKIHNCPAKYVLFRALFYTWLHIPEAESSLPLESVKEYFGMGNLWDVFHAREKRFVAENRNWETFKEIYEHAKPDRSAIIYQRGLLDPAVPLQSVHKVQLELLKEFNRVCEENGLKYMAIHGTLLGAVRHHGFIPWDDDVDVAMPRKDYDRLLELGNASFHDGYFLQTPRNNYGCFYGGYSKLRRDGTAALEAQNKNKEWIDCHQGIWIDILPLDVCPESERKQRQLQHRISVLQRIVYAKAYEPEQFVPKDVTKVQIGLYYVLSNMVRRRYLLTRIENICRNQNLSTMRGILACYYGKRENKNIWSAAAMENTVEMPFEDMLLPVPIGWEEVLCTRYGENYMTLPPPEKRYRHSQTIFDVGQRKDDRNE